MVGGYRWRTAAVTVGAGARVLAMADDDTHALSSGVGQTTRDRPHDLEPGDGSTFTGDSCALFTRHRA